MNTFAEVVETVSHFSTEELKEIKLLVDKHLSDRRIDEIEKSLQEAKQSSDKFTYYSTGEDLLSSLNDE